MSLSYRWISGMILIASVVRYKFLHRLGGSSSLMNRYHYWFYEPFYRDRAKALIARNDQVMKSRR